VELSGTVEFAAPRQAVWDLLMDVDRLAACGPDVDSIQRLDPTHARIHTSVKLGFMTIGATADLELTEIAPQDRVAIRGQGEASGNRLDATGTVELSGPAAGPTTVAWRAEARISGPMAGLASRMIDDAASHAIDQTFDCIRSKLAPA
jgi:carbon monoxide dehydrogenase subunit G